MRLGSLAGLLPSAAAAATSVLVGAALIATRSVIDQVSPASLAFLRYLIGFGCLAPPLLMGGRVRIATRDLAPIALLGIGQFGILVVLLNWSLQFIPSARAALLFATLPLLTLLLGTVLRLEALTAPKMVGVLLALIGVGVALGDKVLQPAVGPESWRGELAAFGSALTGALCSVLYRPYLLRYPTLPVSLIAMLASVGFLALLAARDGFFGAPPPLALGGWLAVLFIGVSSGVGYYLWLWALGHTTPTRVTVFLALSPITVTLLGALLLAEPVSLLALLGLGLVVLGLGFALRPGTRPPSSG